MKPDRKDGEGNSQRGSSWDAKCSGATPGLSGPGNLGRFFHLGRTLLTSLTFQRPLPTHLPPSLCGQDANWLGSCELDLL